jgi:hypothetical protein
MATTLDPANIHNFAGVGTLSNGNLTLASTGNSAAQSTTAASGKKTFQYTISAGVTFWPTSGLSSSSASADGFRIGYQANWVIYNPSGAVVTTGPASPTPAAGMVVTVDVDTVGKTVNVRANGTTVLSNVDISALAPTTWLAIVFATDSSQSGTTFTSTVAFSGLTYAPLAGFSEWDATGGVSITGASAAALAGNAISSPSTQIIQGGGAGSFTFPAAGTFTIDRLFGTGASAGRRGHGSGGGAFAANNFGGAGLAVSAGDVLYWNVPNGPAGTTSASGTNGTDSWARLNVNSAPTTTADGALADSGIAGTSTTDGTGGTVANSIGTTRFAGGAGSSTGSGTTLRGGGGSSAGTGTNGNNASGATAGSAPTGGFAGGAGTTSATGGSGASPGGGGGSTSSSSGTGGAGGSGLLQFTFTAASGSASVNLTGAAAQAQAGTVTTSFSDSVSLTGASASALAGGASEQASKSISGASASALAGSATTTTSDSVAITGAAASALAGAVAPRTDDAVSLTGASCSALAGATAGTSSVALTGASAAAVAGTGGTTISDSASITGASCAAQAGATSTQTADSVSLTGAAASALAGAVTTQSSSGSTVTLTGAAASAIAGGVTTATSDQVSVSGASAAALAGSVGGAESTAAPGAACAALAGSIAAAIQSIATGAMAAALAGGIALGISSPPDGAEAQALAGSVAVQDTGAVGISGAAVQALAGDVTTKIVVTTLNPNYIARGGARSMIAAGAPRARISLGSNRRMVALGQPRGTIATGAKRDRTVVGISNAMSQTENLYPPIDATIEEETVTFDYGLILAAGVTLTGTPTVTCAVYSGTDDSPASRLIGPPAFIKSANSGAANAAVAQLVGDMLAGVTYRLQCVCKTSDGQNLSLWTHLSCQAPN